MTKEEQKQIYKKLKSLLNNGDYLAYFKLAEILTFDKFLSEVLFNNKKPLKKTGGLVFWTNYILESKYYNKILDYPYSYIYLAKILSKEYSYETIRKIAETHPKVLINAIRVSESYLKSDKIVNNLKDINSVLKDEYIDTHIVAMRRIRELENNHWKICESLFETIKDQENPIRLIYEISLWYELSNPGTKESQNLTMAINIALEYLFTKFEFNDIKFTQDGLITVWKQVLQSYSDVKPKKQAVFNWMNSLLKWHLFKANLTEVYSYDLNFEVEINTDNKAVLFPLSNSVFRSWEIANHKLAYFFEEYRDIGGKIYSTLQKENKIENNNTDSDFQNASDYLQETIYGTDFLWTELFGDFNLRLNKEFSYRPVNIQKFNVALIEYIGNSIKRWGLPLNKTGQDINSIKQLSITNTLNGLDIQWLRNMPVHEFTNKSKFSDFSLFFCTSSTIKGFNRFFIKTDINTRPLIEMNDYLFSFTSIIALTNLIPLAINNIVDVNDKQIVHKDISEKFENSISNLFKNQDFNILHIDKKKFVSINKEYSPQGDFDTLAYKDGHLFIIEAKLTHFRLSLSNSHYLTENAFVKAAFQLDKGITFIKDNFAIIKKLLNIKEDSFDDLIVSPYILSFSFENDHKTFKWSDKEFLKISWFELKTILYKESDPALIKNHIELNSLWKSLDSIPLQSVNELSIILP